jgi:hypothetical protein
MTTQYKVAITLACGFAVITAVLIALLLHAPDEIISTNSIAVAEELGVFSRHTTVCQANERIPASTTALRMSLIAYIGPAVSVAVSQGGQVVATGHHNGGWVSGSLTLPPKPAVATPIDATICLTRDRGAELAGLFGNAAPRALAATSNGSPLPGRMRTEYLARGHRSWLSLAHHVARRLGLGHSPSGTWIVLPLVAMMAIAVALGAWLLTRERQYE